MSQDVDAGADAPVTPPGWTPAVPPTPETAPPPSEPAPAPAPTARSGGGLTWTTVKLHNVDAVSDARTSALVAARTFSLELSTYDYHHLDKDFGAVIDHSTGTFKSDFTKASKDLEPLITKYQATSVGDVRASGVQDATADTATVVLFVDQTVKNSNQSQPRVDRNRLRVTLVHSGGGWLVSKVEIL